MKRGTLLTMLLLACGAGLAVWRNHHRASPIVQAPRSSQPTLILFADLREADAACGCGEVIRAVRAAAKSGVALHELEPGSADALVKRYSLETSPTLLLVGVDGTEQARFVGEGPDTIKGLRSRLQGLTSKAK